VSVIPSLDSAVWAGILAGVFLVGMVVLIMALLFDVRMPASLTGAVTLALCRLQGAPKTRMNFVPWLALLLDGLLLVLTPMSVW